MHGLFELVFGNSRRYVSAKTIADERNNAPQRCKRTEPTSGCMNWAESHIRPLGASKTKRISSVRYARTTGDTDGVTCARIRHWSSSLLFISWQNEQLFGRTPAISTAFNLSAHARYFSCAVCMQLRILFTILMPLNPVNMVMQITRILSTR